MKFFGKTKLILVLILIVAALLRLPYLDSLPTGVTIDEAGQGYSAYSILKTGKDEWGDFLPINPRGFGDYKPPVFMYLLVPSIAVFGLNGFAVRFPSAIAGILSVWVMFFLVFELFKDKKLALLASFLLAVSPWHIYYSRLGWESNIGLLFFLGGVWVFLKSLKSPGWFSLSAFLLGLSALSYHSYKLLVPLVVAGLLIIYRREILRINKSQLILPLAVAVVFTFILGYGFIFSGAGRRASDQSIVKEENLGSLRQDQFNDGFPQPLPRILNNKYEFYISKLADNYIGYYSLPFLFGPHRSDGSVLNFPQAGLLYIWQLPLLVFGIWYLIKRKDRVSAVIFLWLFAAPIPASLTQDYMHAGRAQALFPVLTVISVLGLKELWGYLGTQYAKQGFILAAAVVLLSLSLRIDDYLFHTFNKPLGGLVQGYDQISEFIAQNGGKYEKIVFTKAHSEPQAFLAFYGKIDPVIIQQESKDWKKFEGEGKRYLDMTDYRLGKIEFKNIDLSRDRHEQNALIIGSAQEIPPDQKSEVIIKNSVGKVMFIGVDTNEIAD